MKILVYIRLNINLPDLMKRSFLLVFLLAISLKGSSQNLSWANVYGVAGAFSFGYSIAVDAAGNSYATGFYTGNVDFDPGPGVLTLTGTTIPSVFFAKYNSAGNLIWAKKISSTPAGSSGFNEGTSIALDGAGNLYLSGFFFSTPDFDPGPGTSTLTAIGNEDIFFARYDTSGAFVWVRRINNITSAVLARIDIGLAISADATGNVYLTGNFKGTADFDPGTGIFSMSSVPTTLPDIFFAKYDSNGSFIWARQIGSSANDGGTSIKTDASGNVYLTGFFQGTADFDPGAGISSQTGNSDSTAFLAKFDPNGNFIFADVFPGTRSSANSIALDPAGNVYLTGFTFGATDFDPSTAALPLPSAPLGATWNIFFAKYTSSGNLVWANTVNPVSAGANNRGNSVSVDVSGNVYIAGFYSGQNDFDPGAGSFMLGTVAAFPATNAFFARYDTNGNLVWADAVLVNSGAILQFITQTFAIASDNAGNVNVIGKFHFSADFDPGPGVFTLTDPSGNGGSNVFIGRYFRPSPLPVELVSFNAKERNNIVVDCKWRTATEINNDYFAIERSRDAIHFEQAGIVQGSGNTTTVMDYSFTDETPYKGISYYRLKQTDFDGAFSYSDLVTAHIWKSTVAVFPSVSHDFFSVHFCSNYTDDEKMVMKLYACSGQLVKVQQFRVGDLTNRNYVFQREGLSHGLYICIIETETGKQLQQDKIVFQ